jgi:hypothetical protein
MIRNLGEFGAESVNSAFLIQPPEEERIRETLLE